MNEHLEHCYLIYNLKDLRSEQQKDQDQLEGLLNDKNSDIKIFINNYGWIDKDTYSMRISHYD